MNLSNAQAASPRVGDSGAGGTLGGAANAGPAHPDYQVGAVGFGPQWDDEEDAVELTWHGWKRVSDSMAQSIVRLTGDLTTARDAVLTLRRERAAQDALIEELQAEVALLREEQGILKQQLRAAEALGLALVERMKEGK